MILKLFFTLNFDGDEGNDDVTDHGDDGYTCHFLQSYTRE